MSHLLPYVKEHPSFFMETTDRLSVTSKQSPSDTRLAEYNLRYAGVVDSFYLKDILGISPSKFIVILHKLQTLNIQEGTRNPLTLSLLYYLLTNRTTTNNKTVATNLRSKKHHRHRVRIISDTTRRLLLPSTETQGNHYED